MGTTRTIDELIYELDNHPDFLCGHIHTVRSVRHDMLSLYNGILEDEDQINELFNMVIKQFRPQIIQACQCDDYNGDYYWDVLTELVDKLHQHEGKYQKNVV